MADNSDFDSVAADAEVGALEERDDHDDDDDFVLIDDRKDSKSSSYDEEGDEGGRDGGSFFASDPSHPLYFPSTQANEGRDRMKAVERFSVLRWYPYLGGDRDADCGADGGRNETAAQTFRSEFVPLNLKFVQALADLHSHEHLHGPPLSIDAREDLRELTTRIDAAIESVTRAPVATSTTATKNRRRGAFVRLSTRSPKDAAFYDPKIIDKAAKLLAEELSSAQQSRNKKEDVDDEQATMVSLTKAATKLLRVTSGEEAVELIAASPRIWRDLLCCINHYRIHQEAISTASPSSSSTAGDIEDEFMPQVVIREWFDIEPQNEFRVFVIRAPSSSPAGSLTVQGATPVVTGIGAYFHFLYYEGSDLVVSKNYREGLNVMITDYVLNVIDPMLQPLEYERYIVDVALVKDEVSSEDRLIVVELNPFSIATGAGLFDWQQDYDLLLGHSSHRSQENGSTSRSLPEFRVRKTPRASFDGITLLPSGFKDVLQQAKEALSRPSS